MSALTSKALERFMNEARIKLTGASDKGITAELFSVLREFFEDSNCWTEVVPFQPTANVQEYPIILRENGRVLRLIGVRDHNARPVAAFMPDLGTLVLSQTLNNTPPSQWEVKVVKGLSLPTTREGTPIVPNDLFLQYESYILDGLLGRMMGQQSKSFSNSTMSVYHLRRFRTGIQIARTAAERMNTVGAQAWAFPQTFRTNTQRSGVSTAFPRF